MLKFIGKKHCDIPFTYFPTCCKRIKIHMGMMDVSFTLFLPLERTKRKAL
jgi:hypothetical protein